MKILNLYAGIGGNRKLWGNMDVTAIEYNQEIADVYKKNFPNDKVIVTDAHEYLLNNFKEFDFIWSSPPCPTHSRMAKFTRHEVYNYPDMKLYEEIIFLQHFFDGKWVVENVTPYYTPLIPTREVDRHLMWSNFKIGKFKRPKFNGNYMKAKKEDLEDYFGFDPIPNIYPKKGSHCPSQVLRNCVHPETGLYVLNCALDIIHKENPKQLNIFDE